MSLPTGFRAGDLGGSGAPGGVGVSGGRGANLAALTPQEADQLLRKGLAGTFFLFFILLPDLGLLRIIFFDKKR